MRRFPLIERVVWIDDAARSGDAALRKASYNVVKPSQFDSPEQVIALWLASIGLAPVR